MSGGGRQRRCRSGRARFRSVRWMPDTASSAGSSGWLPEIHRRDPLRGFRQRDAHGRQTWPVSGGSSAVGNRWDSSPTTRRYRLCTSAPAMLTAHAQTPQSAGGDNLFLCSIVAAMRRPGAYKWHYPETPPRTGITPAPNPSCRPTSPSRVACAGCCCTRRRMVFFYVIEPRHGELISAKNHVPVNWARHRQDHRPPDRQRSGPTRALIRCSYTGTWRCAQLVSHGYSPQTGWRIFPTTTLFVYPSILISRAAALPVEQWLVAATRCRLQKRIELTREAASKERPASLPGIR